MYLFDTDVIVELLRGTSDSGLRQKIAKVSASDQYISTISVAELVYGAWRSQRPQYHLKKIREKVVGNVRIVSFDIQSAWLAGRLRADLAKAGTTLDFPDLQIAAIALSQSLTLVTGNTKHFDRVPHLKLENWLRKA